MDDPRVRELHRDMRRGGWFMVVWSAGVFVWSAIFERSLLGCVASLIFIVMGAAFIFAPTRRRLTIVCAGLAVALLIVAMVMVLRMRGIL